jgi:hypothetical protein
MPVILPAGADTALAGRTRSVTDHRLAVCPVRVGRPPRPGNRWPGSRWPDSRWPDSRWPGNRWPGNPWADNRWADRRCVGLRPGIRAALLSVPLLLAAAVGPLYRALTRRPRPAAAPAG